MITALFFIFVVSGCVQAQTPDQQADLPAHHSEDGGFRNPHLEPGKRGFFKYMKMRYFSDEEFADNSGVEERIPTIPPDLQKIRNPQQAPQLTWIGHATVLIHYQGLNILTDPNFSDRASPVSFAGPKRFTDPALQFEDLPSIDFVLISHSHYDHLDRRSVSEIGNTVVWLVPLGLKQWLQSMGISEENIVEFDWWDARQYPKVTITATPAQHWSARTLWDRNQSLWASWVIQIENFTVWYSGDTGYNPYQFKEIGEKFNDIDLSLITIGAYEPRWFMKDMHVNPDEAVQLHEDVRSKYSLAVQWGTFVLTAEPLDEPPLKLKEALEKRGIPQQEFEIMKIGETKSISLD